MKKTLFTFFIALFSITALHHTTNAQSILVHYWHFNNINTLPNMGFSYSITPSTPTIPSIAADYSRIDTAKARIHYTQMDGVSSAYSSVSPYTYMDTLNADTDVPASYDTINLRLGQLGGYCVRARNPSDSMQLLFYIPSTHYQNILVTYGTQASSTTHGQWEQHFQYSSDSGATWKTTGLSVTVDSAWLVFNRVSVNITDPSANNNPRLVFQIIFQQNTTNVTGNNRFDNITVDADTFISSSVPYVTPNFDDAINISPNPASDYIDMTTTMEINRAIMVYNTAGETVFAGITGKKDFRLDISKYSAGIYYIIVKNNANGTTQTLKFVKN